jgi:glycosyltransferase involved in cell wall biosynthesis
LGRIDPIKRIEWLLDLKGIIGNRLRIVIAGGAQNSATEEYLQNLVKCAGKTRQVIFTGPVQGEVKSELLSNCLFFINPSLYEGLPITVMEAVSYGRCCLTSDIPAHAEVIDHGKTGFLFPRDNKSEFISLVKELSSMSGEALDTIGASAVKKLQVKFDWEKTARGFEYIYRRLAYESR